MTHETFSEETSTLGSSDRVLGLVFSLAFAILAVFPVLHGKPIRVWALVVGSGFLISALLFPSILHPLNLLWMQLGLLISKVTNPLITGLMFYGVFTPAALVARLPNGIVGMSAELSEISSWPQHRPTNHGGPQDL